ncbi:YceD family protein [Marivivens aquimaris]|uniref:YceD family protein n=1 Tax=Marivivens aquimaris TaxID=2774876 RepID=UPI001880283C|nr:DUF177 domain-containing protein [Marivivens aquimaris]
MGSTDKHIYRLSELSGRTEVPFTLEPDADARAKLARVLDIPKIRKLRFEGQLLARGKTDWHLHAKLGATVVQECVVTLEPVTTRIDESIVRAYVHDYEETVIGEVEMPDDDSIEPLPTAIDLYEVMSEALSLALPPFPRAEGVELGEAVYTEKGIAPMRDEDTKPFAGLKSLRDSLEKPEKE